MHIAFITSHFPFHNAKSVGGIGTSIKNLSDELVTLGHKVSVFVYGQKIDENLMEGGIAIFKIRNIKIKGISKYLTEKKIQKTIISVNKISKIDIVETPDWEGITSFINLQCPIVVRLNGSDTYFCHLDNRPVKWINKFHEKRALERADGYLSVSQFTADLTNQLFGLNKKFTSIPNGINTTFFNKTDNATSSFICNSLGSETQKEQSIKTMNILYFGGIIRKKGLLEIPHYFNRVVKKIPNVQLILIGKDMSDKFTGNTSTFQMMEKLFSSEARLKTKFLGSIPYHEIKQHIENATVCIFPSFAEALPVSWLEAMALEKAVVASNIGWSNEIIDNGINGFMVNPILHDDFALNIVNLLENDELRRKIEKNARKKIVQVFASEVTAARTIEYYEEIIKKKCLI
jgi:glycosyltransferase involved in cell wall biosynthesis